MGTQSSKSSSSHGQEYEQQLIKIFNTQNLREVNKLDNNRLNSLWGSWMRPELVDIYSNFIEWRSKKLAQKSNISSEQHAFMSLHSTLSRGDLSDVADLLIYLIEPSTREKTDPPDMLVPLPSLIDYIGYLFESAVIYSEHKASRSFLGWLDVGATRKEETLRTLSLFLTKDLKCDSNKVGRERLECWLFSCPLFNVIQTYVLDHAYMYERNISKGHMDILPVPEHVKRNCSVLDMYHVVWLNSCLPAETQTKWRLLYSTSESGESWTTFLKSIVDQGPTIVAIRDREGALFGGFASTSWNVSPQFFGTNRCFLFTLEPMIEKFDPTNYNSNFQYINTGQTTFPNGMGMGGQLDYWGVFIDSSMTHGSVSPSCSTFANYRQPCVSQTFQVDAIEVWGVGEKPVPPQEEGERISALDSQLEARAMLEMIGRGQVSEGLREPIVEE